MNGHRKEHATASGSLVTKARDGDAEALGLLLARSRERLERVAQRSMGPGVAARTRVSDIVQSACLEAIAKVGGFRGDRESAFARWLDLLVINKVRRQGRRHMEHDGADEQAIADEETPSGQQLRIERAKALDESVALLSPREQALILASFQGWSAQRIGEALDTTEVSARSQLRRARQSLRRLLESQA